MLMQARVVENRTVGRQSFVLRLAGCDALGSASPGQFVMVRGEWQRDPLLPRAFSILRTLAGGECELLGKAIGRGTRLLAALCTGAQLSLLGPLGRPFPAPQPGRKEILVAGGVGLAPLLWHAERARTVGTAAHLFYGARSAQDLVLLDEIGRTGCALTLATEDGSQGARGRVTDALKVHLSGQPASAALYSCGPSAMMRQVAALANAHHLDCMVSVEGEMACGFGVCLGCAVPTRDPARPFVYACTDGPVFDAAGIEIP